MSRLYRSLRATLRAAVNVFYGDIEVTGAAFLPATGPIIIACNHPNSIVDPLLLGTVTDRPITYCARDGLFRVPLFGRLLRAIGAIPIRRRSEHATADNTDAFAAAGELLGRGGVMAIFPEGKTHGHLRIEPIKTGTARIAYAAQTSATAGPPVRIIRIIPVAITYLVRHAFRSDIHVAFGPPIDVAEVIASVPTRDVLAPLCDQPHTPTAFAAALALTVARDPRAGKTLLAALQRPEDRGRALEALAALGPLAPPEALPIVRRLARSFFTPGLTRVRAAYALARLAPPEGEAILERLSNALRSSVREAVTDARAGLAQLAARDAARSLT